MSLKQIADDTASALVEAIEDHDFSEEQLKTLQSLIEQSIVQTVEQARQAHKEATVECCGAEADIAHKIADETKRKTRSLISNLNSLR